MIEMNSTIALLFAGAMLIAFVGGLVVGVMLRPLPGPPVPHALDDLPADHPLRVLVGTVIVDRGELR